MRFAPDGCEACGMKARKRPEKRIRPKRPDTFFRHSPLLPSCVSFMPACLFYTFIPYYICNSSPYPLRTPARRIPYQHFVNIESTYQQPGLRIFESDRFSNFISIHNNTSLFRVLSANYQTKKICRPRFQRRSKGLSPERRSTHRSKEQPAG